MEPRNGTEPGRKFGKRIADNTTSAAQERKDSKEYQYGIRTSSSSKSMYCSPLPDHLHQGQQATPVTF